MFLRLGGAFVMSDDSHGIDQIGTNYARLLSFIQKAGIEELHYIDPSGVREDKRFPSAGFASITTSGLAASPFWEASP
jgi:histidinol-phosphatase (PHP family)